MGLTAAQKPGIIHPSDEASAHAHPDELMVFNSSSDHGSAVLEQKPEKAIGTSPKSQWRQLSERRTRWVAEMVLFAATGFKHQICSFRNPAP